MKLSQRILTLTILSVLASPLPVCHATGFTPGHLLVSSRFGGVQLVDPVTGQSQTVLDRHRAFAFSKVGPVRSI